ncbi:hypothetical protein [Pseudomonas sp. REB1044]|uniref:hypothetical protein n=1 Tax=Pseudomonas sp. REB1044 TaxID=2675224 RepID=UPI00315D7623
MSDVKVAKVKLYNDKLKSGFLAHEIDDEDVILPTEAVGSLSLNNEDEVSFEVRKDGDKHYATNVKLVKKAK